MNILFWINCHLSIRLDDTRPLGKDGTLPLVRWVKTNFHLKDIKTSSENRYCSRSLYECGDCKRPGSIAGMELLNNQQRRVRVKCVRIAEKGFC
jgi:hypothetical protein